MPHVENSLFSSRQVSEIIGLSRRQVQHWSHSRLINPEYRTLGGHARYSFQDLVAFRTARKLQLGGVSLQRLRKSITRLQELLPTIKRPLSDLTLVTTGDVVLVFHAGVVFEALSGQEWIVEVAEVQQAVEDWRRRSRLLKPVRGSRLAGTRDSRIRSLSQ